MLFILNLRLNLIFLLYCPMVLSIFFSSASWSQGTIGTDSATVKSSPTVQRTTAETAAVAITTEDKTLSDFHFNPKSNSLHFKPMALSLLEKKQRLLIGCTHKGNHLHSEWVTLNLLGSADILGNLTNSLQLAELSSTIGPLGINTVYSECCCPVSYFDSCGISKHVSADKGFEIIKTISEILKPKGIFVITLCAGIDPERESELSGICSSGLFSRQFSAAEKAQYILHNEELYLDKYPHTSSVLDFADDLKSLADLSQIQVIFKAHLMQSVNDFDCIDLDFEKELPILLIEQKVELFVEEVRKKDLVQGPLMEKLFAEAIYKFSYILEGILRLDGRVVFEDWLKFFERINEKAIILQK